MNSFIYEAAKKVMNNEGYLIDPDFNMVAIRFKSAASELMNDTLLISTPYKVSSYKINTIPSKESILSSGQYTYIKEKKYFSFYGQQRSSVCWTDKEGYPKCDEYNARLEGFNLIFNPIHSIFSSGLSSAVSKHSKGSQIISTKAYKEFKEYAPETFLYTLIDLEDIEKILGSIQ